MPANQLTSSTNWKPVWAGSNWATSNTDRPSVASVVASAIHLAASLRPGPSGETARSSRMAATPTSGV